MDAKTNVSSGLDWVVGSTLVVCGLSFIGALYYNRPQQQPQLSDRISSWEAGLKAAEKNNDYDAALKILKGYIAMRDPKDMHGIIVNGNPGADVYGDLTGDIDADGAAFMDRALEYGLKDDLCQKFLDDCVNRNPVRLKLKHFKLSAEYEKMKENSGMK